MKTKWVTCVFLVLVAAALRLPAQQSDAARKLFEETKTKAENGDVNAQRDLGLEYEVGKAGGNYVAQDFAEAMKWYRKSADQGSAIAQLMLAQMYANGEGVDTNLDESAKWYRKAADQNFATAQFILGTCYSLGNGVVKDDVEALKWYRKAAELGYADAQFNLGIYYFRGQGVAQNYVEAVKWYRKAVDQGHANAEANLGVCYEHGQGVTQDYAEAMKWYCRAAVQGNDKGQCNLGILYAKGEGVTQNYLEAYYWFTLAAAQGNILAASHRDVMASHLSQEEISEGQRRAASFVPRQETTGSNSENSTSPSNPTFTGTGFFITDDGYLISNYHVVKGAAKVRLLTGAGLIDASVVKVDAANDLALLKAVGRFAPLPIAASRTVKLGGTVATVGFPDIGLQGFAPKLAKGEIASLAGAGDDPRYFQISVPVQHGNSGGALVDVHGNVVGIVAARLGVEIGKAVTSDELPENVNYAVKSSLLLSFLESVPDVSAKLKDPNTKDEAFEDVVKSAQDAAVLVLVY